MEFFFKVAPAVKYSGSRNDIRSHPPSLGEHTDEVIACELVFLFKNMDSAVHAGAERLAGSGPGEDFASEKVRSRGMTIKKTQTQTK